MTLAAIKDPAMSGQTEYERVEGDFYATPPENVDCLVHYVPVAGRTIWEPACGEGHISKRLSHLRANVVSTELYQRGYGTQGVDFLKMNKPPRDDVDGIITNPPYGKMVEKFLHHALKLMEPVGGTVAMFLRNEYDCRSTGCADLFEGHPAYHKKIIVTKRPLWIEGSKGSPRHNYAWYVWDFNPFQLKMRQDPTIHYIHPRDATAKVRLSSIK